VEPLLCDHLDTLNIDFLHFGFRWMNCLLMRELNLECVLRLWDAYISEGERFPQFHVYVCVAFLKSIKASIMGQDFQFVMKKLQVMGKALSPPPSSIPASSPAAAAAAAKSLSGC
jgi:hypothetical protein